MIEKQEFEHSPVLFREVQELYMKLPTKKTVIDATLGLWGHARFMIEGLDESGVFIWFDRDAANLEQAKRNLTQISSQKTLHFLNRSFAEIDAICDELKIPNIDFILYDLWVSSAHYDDGDRGFSIRFDAPLDMRFDRSQWMHAWDIVNTMSARELMHIFQEYGEEKKAFFIAEAIVKARQKKKIMTTYELLDIIRASSFDKKSPIRVFQALRIAVNDEFGHIKKSLDSVSKKMNIGWHIAVITFHSLEDRMVKNIFSELCSAPIDEITGRELRPAYFQKVTKKPIEPTIQEVQTNPRSRSAKIRIIKKINSFIVWTQMFS